MVFGRHPTRQCYATTSAQLGLEFTLRPVNLLVGPLFVIFFLAIFIPWSSKCGVWIAAIVSLFIALFIAFPWAFGVTNLSIGFNWILIGSLTGGIITGMLSSPFMQDKKQ